MAVNVTGGALEFDAVINDSQFGAVFRRMEAQIQGLTDLASRQAREIDSLVKKATRAIASYAGAFSATAFISDVIRVRAEFQKLEAVLTNALGDRGASQKALKQVQEFVATTPFELAEVSAAYVKLVNQGLKPTRDQLTSIGDLAASQGKGFDQLVEAIIDAQTGEFERLKEFGVRASKEGEKVTFTFRGIKTEVDFTSQAIVDYVNGLGKLEGVTGSTAAISKTLGGQISNLRDAWTNMLNEVGQSGEGVFSDAISAAKFLVDNYQDVLDILKVLIITYGSYRAALIATVAVQNIATAATKGYTIAEILRYQAMLLSEKAMKLLNATLLKNPAAFVIAGIAGLVAALTLFGKKASEVKSKTELLNEANEKTADSFAKQEAKIRPYLEALKAGNVSEQERINIYNKLKEVDPKIVAGLNAKTLSYDALTKNVNLYLDALRNQLKLEANKEAVQLSIKEEIRLKKQLDEENRRLVVNIKKRGQDDAYVNLQQKPLIERLGRQLAEQKKVTQQLGEEQVTSEKKIETAKARTLKVVEDEIKALKEQQTKQSESNKQYQEFQKKINTLELERKKIIGATKADVKAAQVEENKALSMMEKRKSLLEKIQDLVDASRQSGQTKQLTELDKINEKYDDIILSISEYNKKVDEFNKKNPKNLVDKIGQADINALNDARKKELTNERLREDADLFKKNLDVQKRAFEQFEEAKKQVGIKKAKELFADQTKEYDSFLTLLQKEAQRLLPKIQFGIANVGEIEKFKAIVDAIKQHERDKAEEEIENQKRDFIELLQASATYNQQKAEINKRYDDLEATLRKNSTISEFEERKEILDVSRQEELTDLDNSIARQSALYKKLNQDILLFTRERLKQEVRLLKEKLKLDTTLSPQQKADIESTIGQYESLLDETNEVRQDFQKLSEQLAGVGGIFSELASSVSVVNDSLTDTLQTLSDIIDIGVDAAKAIAQFAAGDIVGGISSSVKAIAGVFSIGKKARESRRQAEQEVAEFNARVLAGEIAITQEYRNRQREQVKLNKLKLEGLESERRLLEEQKRSILDQYQTILAQLQNETFVADVVTKKYGGVLGVGRKTKTVEIRETLNGMTFEQMEALFSQGRLTGRAKELFEMLQRIKQEGADIDALLAENAEQAKQIFTGTTTDSIVDAIASGFANGLDSAADFASTFEDFMRGAIINSLKFKYLEAPLKEFFDQFAAASESDSQLTNAEINQLQNLFNTIIGNANQQFQQLQQIAGINFTGAGTQGNSLTGAIKGITEQQAELLAGQFGGLRITALDQLNISRSSLTALNAIQVNTGVQIQKLVAIYDRLQYYYEVRGVKIL